jgi:hypothetical protein
VPLVHVCAEEGCTVLTMGHFCIDHENDQAKALDAALMREIEFVTPALDPVMEPA